MSSALPACSCGSQPRIAKHRPSLTSSLMQFEESLLAHQIQNSEEPEAVAEDGDSDGDDFLLKDDGSELIELR